MKSRRQADWSFLLMRGAEHSVKQFTIKKRSLVATPVALIAIVTSCFIGMKLQSASEIKELELRLEQLNDKYVAADSSYNTSLENHQSKIISLEHELLAAYEKQKKIDEKLMELQALEAQLEQFMKTYGSEISVEFDRQTKKSDFSLSHEYKATPNQPIPLSHQDIASNEATSRTITVNQLSYKVSDTASSVAHKTISDSPEAATHAALFEMPIDQLTKVVDNFIEVMHYNLNKAGKLRENIDAYPNFWPSDALMTTSGFGYRVDPFTKTTRFHAGIDINGQHGDVIFSAGDGVVIDADYHPSFGYYIIVEHSDQLKTLYGHLQSIEANIGDDVVKGEKIGKMGSTGRSTGAHLHFQVMLNNKPVSPLKFLIKP